MKQITLNIAENKLDFFIDLIRNFDFVKVEKQAELTKTEILQTIKKGKKLPKPKKEKGFFLSAGIWENKDISAESLRKEAWKRK